MPIKLLILVAVSFHLSACSVFMAATGTDPINESLIKVGATRQQIESELGSPITFYRQMNGDFATYQVITGDKPSYRRAATYAVLDGLTIGLAEFVSFPTEALQGDQNIYEITYDAWGRAKKIEYFFKEAPLPNPDEVIEEHLKDDETDV